MHHFRGTLLEGGEIRLDPASVYVQYHHAAPGGPATGWHGYLLVDPETDLEPGVMYTLTLADGRSGSLRVDHIAPDDSGQCRVVFAGEGALE